MFTRLSQVSRRAFLKFAGTASALLAAATTSGSLSGCGTADCPGGYGYGYGYGYFGGRYGYGYGYGCLMDGRLAQALEQDSDLVVDRILARVLPERRWRAHDGARYRLPRQS